MDVLDLTRLQFAVVTIYHYLFVPLSICLSAAAAGLHLSWLRSGSPERLALTKFVGKLLILDSTFAMPGWHAIWTTILASTLLGVIGFARSGSTIFWKAAPAGTDAIAAAPRARLDYLAPVTLLALLAALTIGAGWVTTQTRAAAHQVMAPERYIAAVLGAAAR